MRESDRYLEFTIECPPGDADALVESRYTLGRQLGCAVDGEVVGSTTLRLKLSRMNQLAVALLADTGGDRQPLLVPIGASDSGIYYLNLATVGSVLVAGGRLEARELLTSWFTTLDSLHPEGDGYRRRRRGSLGPVRGLHGVVAEPGRRRTLR
ncbi:MAG: hypothetical protein M5U18_04435 [Dehalococcoidia bacterium]|nr:hypothetical protein [Dehalococcoidia bacterium]